jgi:hypothetical protein
MNCGFDPTYFGASRITNFINNAYFNMVRRVDYYIDESSNDYNTIAGTNLYALPTDFARVRSVRDTSRQQEMYAVGLRDIDRSIASSGAPIYYALDAANVHLYPTPDQSYPIEVRYWKLPTALVNDTDVPTIPADYHNLLIYSAVAECYRAEDDPATAQQWQALYDKGLAEFSADVKFPNDDAPTQLKGMFDGGRALSGRGWSVYGSEWGY